MSKTDRVSCQSLPTWCREFIEWLQAARKLKQEVVATEDFCAIDGEEIDAVFWTEDGRKSANVARRLDDAFGFWSVVYRGICEGFAGLLE